MKKFFPVLVAAALAVPTFAQTASELAEQKAELDKVHMKMLNVKPTKDAKKQAKEYKKEGWKVPAGMKSIEKQLTECQLYAEELMTDESGNIAKRYIQQTGITTAGTYNAGYASARANAQAELGAALKTQIASAIQLKIDNAQSSTITAVTVDKFNERARMIVDATLTNCLPTLTIYRRLKNNNFEVQVMLTYDKKELGNMLKQNMQKELEVEGDELIDLVDDVLQNNI